MKQDSAAKNNIFPGKILQLEAGVWSRVFCIQWKLSFFHKTLIFGVFIFKTAL